MEQYHSLVSEVLSRGVKKKDRTGVGTKSLFGRQARFDLTKGFPIVTSKFTSFRLVKEELLFFLRGGRNIRSLVKRGVGIWSDWPLKKFNQENGTNLTKKEFETCIVECEDFAEEWGDLGPIYGAQWRGWRKADGGVVDQIAEVQENLKTDPDSRRHYVTAWNPGEISQMALPACHVSFQFYSRPYEVRTMEGAQQRRALDCQVTQRSCDLFLGVPFNWASYGLLTHMMAQCTDHTPGELVWNGGDVHLYSNSFKEAERLLGRPRHPLPRLSLNLDKKYIDEFEIVDIQLSGYKHGDKIGVPVAV